MKNKEIRNFDIELRADEGRHIEGYGSVFNSRSVDLGGFKEIIAPGAFDGVIERSDVKCYLDHNPERGILARSRNGKGSLALGIDERGLSYSFDAPHTNLGDEVVEGLKRGDYSQSSFAFTVESETWSKEEDGTYLRTINKVGDLFDVSIVANPAYTDTEVALRSLDKYKRDEEDDKEEEKPEEEQPENETPTDTPNEDKEKEEEREEEEDPDKEDEKEDEENRDEEEEDKDKDKENESEGQEVEPEDKRNHNKKINMGKFSLIRAINDVVNNRNINEEALNVIEMGANEMRKSGLSFSGQIQLPVEERADLGAIAATQATYGQEIVATDKLDILEPLRGKSILSEVGATFLTGLVGNVSIPAYSGSTCGWKGELETADDGKGTFDSVEFAPKRLTAYVDISKQFLMQDSVGAEEMLRADIVNALVSKLEQTIFGDAAGDANKPAGIFESATVVEPSYAAACDAEAELVDFRGEKKYIMSPTAKAKFKQTTISGSKTDLRLLCENNEVNGLPVVSSSNVVAGGYAVGDFSELVVAQWGSIDLVVDPYTLATKNAIRLVINAYFDAKFRRDGAVVVNKIA